MLYAPVSPKGKLLVYTRTPEPEAYCTALAGSVHLAYSRDGIEFLPLNHNYGVLFPKATLHLPDTLSPKAVKAPWLFQTKEGGFGIAAVRIGVEGEDDEESRGSVLLWVSDDLIRFTELGLLDLKLGKTVEAVSVCYDGAVRAYVLNWKDEDGFHRSTLTDLYDFSTLSAPTKGTEFSAVSLENVPEGAVCGNVLEVNASFGERLLVKRTPLYNVAVTFPEKTTVSSKEEFDALRATAVYSDGSTALKQVKWDNLPDFSAPGSYELTGTATQREYPFPLSTGWADPEFMFWEGKWYFLATNDNNGCVGLFLREADTLEGLFAEDVEIHCFLEKNEEKGFIQTFWAPEFHIIGDDLYVLFAVSGSKWGPQSQILKHKKGMPLTSPDAWEEPVRVRKADGSPLAEGIDDITLDMTHFVSAGKDYYSWSYRIWTGRPEDSGSMVYIAEIDPAHPEKLLSEPVLLTRPVYGWENVHHTINNEGPYAFVTDDTVYLAYSGGAARGYSYSIGLLTAPVGADLCDPDSWEKANSPILAYPFTDEYGCGHNAFFCDEDGNLMISYHAEEEYIIDGGLCGDGVHRIHFDIDGEPRFDLSAARDLDKSLCAVKTTVVVK